MYERENGKLFVKTEGIEYAKKGELATATEVVLYEPVKSSAVDCMRLMQKVRRATLEVSKFFDAPAEQKAGGEAIPFHKQENPDEKECQMSANGIIELVLASSLDPEEFLRMGKGLLCKRYDSTVRRHLCTISDEYNTPMTPVIFDSMSIEDQMYLIALYIVFFDLSSTGVQRSMSSTV